MVLQFCMLVSDDVVFLFADKFFSVFRPGAACGEPANRRLQWVLYSLIVLQGIFINAVIVVKMIEWIRAI